MSTFVIKNPSLQMPTSFVEIDREEMEYIDGGSYTTYRGYSGWLQITKMMDSVATHGGTAWGLAKATMALSATGIGLVFAVASAIGAQIFAASAGVQMSMVATALLYMKMDNGFRSKSFGAFGWSWDMVKRIQ